ncbi:hypothetical protein JQ594_33000 [Bradyrhizobium manausense]|uniref:hypothetical protein n=1 Tax=Bradyrhizobium manausense TaxID=989370 RepID=UPI001BA86636|nr:hypothetical protein [Bradyrhizobium manausense]MBR0690770.1 hypothetical protein [Bradyrhizobium manausense]
MKFPEFRLSYMAIVAGLASDLAAAAKGDGHDASVMGRIWHSRVRTAQFARTGVRDRIWALVAKALGRIE